MVKYPIDIGFETQLLFDDHLVADRNGFVTTLNPAVRGDSNPVLKTTEPWEGALRGAPSVVKDDQLIRMWYPVSVQTDDVTQTKLAYARSRNGIQWEKPSLEEITSRDGEQTNLVFELPESRLHKPGKVFRDPNGPPEKRFKYIYGSGNTAREYDGWDTMYYHATSPDGIHWTTQDDEPLLPNRYDSQNLAIWDARLEQYVLYGKYCQPIEPEEWDYEDDAWGKAETTAHRAGGRAASQTFGDFPEFEPVIYPDEAEQSGELGAPMDVYSYPVVNYPSGARSYLMFPDVYYHDPPHTRDVQLATSRDGRDWHRFREPFLRLGPEGAFDSRSLMMGLGMIPVDDELWLYYLGSDHPHGPVDRRAATEATRGIGQVSVRVDGFVSQDAPATGGHLTTVPLTFSDQSPQATEHTPYQLLVNMDASAGGWLSVELLDADSEQLRGYGKSEADRLWGNDSRKVVTWNGNSDIAPLHGAETREFGVSGPLAESPKDPIRLRFHGRRVKLYSFRIVEASTLSTLW